MAIVDDLQGDLVPTLRLDGEAVVAERREQAPRTGEQPTAREGAGFDTGSLFCPRRASRGAAGTSCPLRRETAPKVGV
jgi:hypothetical protein